VSSDLERRIREARAALPEPDAEATRRAHTRALRTVRRRRPRVRLAVLAGVALALALVLGAGLGTLIAPSGTAAGGPIGLGFLPEPGWYVLQSGARATSSAPATAMASNVAFDPEDDVRGLAESSGLPYPTLLTLPPRGIVIVATFTPRGEPAFDTAFRKSELPLRVRDAVAETRYGKQVRPEEPLGVYRLQAAVNGQNVDVHVYYGTPDPSSALRAEAQRQLERLVVSAKPSPAKPAARQPDAVATASAPGIIDRTFVCSPIAYGGVGDLDVSANPSREDAFGRRFVASLDVRTGPSTLDSTLVLVRAAAQPKEPGLAIPWPVAGRPGVYAHSRRCTSSRVSVRLSRKGLAGPPIAWQKDLDCSLRGRVLVRVRAVLESAAPWRRQDASYSGARKSVTEASLAVSSQASGKPIAYMELDAGKRTKLWYSPGCRS